MEKIKTIISTVLNVLGALWLTVEIIDYFGGKENAEKSAITMVGFHTYLYSNLYL
ncbi:hypothetical protein [Aeromonas veronii]|uniref:hypothetical protein n=1 Tax=Aeromonas veronii TaxID=654 RepID=UPI00293740DE|nr:hypothetical protein [Aeromonas veronii]WOE83601.1 hypothetical protein RY930_16205 [Aeromonas veronii]